MKRTPEGTTPPAESWELMGIIRDCIGQTRLHNIFSRSHGHMRKWMCRPENPEHERNPLDRMRLLLASAHESGGEVAARMAVAYLLEPLGLQAVPVESAEPDGDSVEAEALDDYPTLVRAHEAVRSINGLRPVSPRSVDALMQDHIDECRQTVAKYRADYETRFGGGQ